MPELVDLLVAARLCIQRHPWSVDHVGFAIPSLDLTHGVIVTSDPGPPTVTVFESPLACMERELPPPERPRLLSVTFDEQDPHLHIEDRGRIVPATTRDTTIAACALNCLSAVHDRNAGHDGLTYIDVRLHLDGIEMFACHPSPHLATDEPILDYDPDQAPSPCLWIDSQLHLHFDAILTYHNDHIDDAWEIVWIHSLAHLLAEEALFERDPPCIRALERLLAAGATRHQAIHAIGNVLLHSHLHCTDPCDLLSRLGLSP
jgi:hypothetical protein